MDIGGVRNTGMQRQMGETLKPAEDTSAKIDTNDYWVAGGQRYGNLIDLGEAFKSGKLQIPKSGKVPITHKTFRPEEGMEMVSQSKKWGMGALAGLGLSMGFAALGVVSAPLVLIPLMAGMISGGIAAGLYETGKDFQKDPQIKSQGTISMENNKAILTFPDTNI